MSVVASRPFLGLALAASLLALAPLPARAETPAPPASAAPPERVPPRLLDHPEVPYPAGGQGDAEVIVDVIVNADGSVREATPSRGEEPFASQAAAAVRGWRFEPARVGDRVMAAKIRLAVVFHAPVVVETPASPAGSSTLESSGVVPGEGPPKEAGGGASAPVVPRAQGRRQDEVIVVGERPEPSRSVSLSRAEVRQIPGTFGDPFRAVEIMPGVTPIASGLPFFFIRGAPPGNVGYYLDGVRLPLLFHIGAGPSVVHPGLIERVDLYPGGYPARFGRFAGGIVSGETAQPGGELHGEYNLRLFDAGAMVETPFADGRGTALIGGRYSYTGALLTLLSPTVKLDYWDYQARLTYDLTADDRVSVLAFGSYDYLGQRTATTTTTVFGTQFHRGDVRYDHRLGDRGTIRLAVMGGLDRTAITEERALRDRVFGVRSELTYRLSPEVLLRAGTDAQMDSYDIELGPGDLGPNASRITALFPTRSDVAVAVRGDAVVAVAPGLEVTPGLRVEMFGSQGATAVGVDPRLALRLTLTDRLRMLSALGIAHQPPAFVLPVPGFQPGGLRGGLQTAAQESVGLEFEVDAQTTATATVFHNAFFNMSDPLGGTAPQVRGCPPGSFSGDSLSGDRGQQPNGGGAGCGPQFFDPGTLGPDRSGGGGQGADGRRTSTAATALEVRTLGSSYGLELFVKRRLTHRLGGFLSYTLSRSTRSVGQRSFIASFDRTHVLNVALAYNLGRNWRAGTRVVFYTGLPQAPDPTRPGDTRLPAFFRLDLRLEKRWQLGRQSWISFVAEWMNATLSKEAVTSTCTLQGCQAQTIGPITIPSLGVEGGFLADSQPCPLPHSPVVPPASVRRPSGASGWWPPGRVS